MTIKGLLKLTQAKPVSIKRRFFFFKVTLSGIGRKSIARECHNSSLSIKSTIFRNHRIRLWPLAPGLAFSRLRSDSCTENKKKQFMLDFLVRNNCQLSGSEKKSGYNLIRDYARYYAISLDHAPAEITLSLQSLDYEVPVTFMHGDYVPANAVYNGRLLLVDWESAFSGGTLLFDWWCFYQKITLDKNTSADFIDRLDERLNEALLACGLTRYEWEKLGAGLFYVKARRRSLVHKRLATEFFPKGTLDTLLKKNKKS